MPTKPSVTRILLVDDHPICRQGLREIIESQKDLSVCGTAEDIHTALAEAEKLRPDLVMIDISLKDSNGLELLKDLKVRSPELKVLMLSMHDEVLYAQRALRAGAGGYIMKQEATDKVLTAIRRVLGGDVYLSERMERKLMQQLVGGKSPKLGRSIEDLSDRELQVFNLIGEGKGTRQIAELLHLSIKTIESHRAHIKEKLGLSNANELVQHAIQCANSELGGVPSSSVPIHQSAGQAPYPVGRSEFAQP
jgi:DNA-binding NarL/FixJ family response regulator